MDDIGWISKKSIWVGQSEFDFAWLYLKNKIIGSTFSKQARSAAAKEASSQRSITGRYHYADLQVQAHTSVPSAFLFIERVAKKIFVI